jgi:hypothetical protein
MCIDLREYKEKRGRTSEAVGGMRERGRQITRAAAGASNLVGLLLL